MQHCAAICSTAASVIAAGSGQLLHKPSTSARALVDLIQRRLSTEKSSEEKVSAPTAAAAAAAGGGDPLAGEHSSPVEPVASWSLHHTISAVLSEHGHILTCEAVAPPTSAAGSSSAPHQVCCPRHGLLIYSASNFVPLGGSVLDSICRSTLAQWHFLKMRRLCAVVCTGWRSNCQQQYRTRSNHMEEENGSEFESAWHGRHRVSRRSLGLKDSTPCLPLKADFSSH